MANKTITIAGHPVTATRVLTRFACYLGIGALLHAIFHDAALDPASAWTWAYLLAWPVVVVLSLLKWGILGIGWLIVACMGLKSCDLMRRARTLGDGLLLAAAAAALAAFLVLVA